MTSLVAARRRPVAVPCAIVALVLVRLGEIRAGASPDEGGFLLVAGQWHAGGGSLYGRYWVDRPPLLLGLYRLAGLLGGSGHDLLALRLLGILAAAVTVGALASTARRMYGPRAAGVAAVVAAALLVSPLYGAVDVNGELLAAPFVALGLRGSVEVVRAQDRTLARAAAVATGLMAVAAALVKQNMLDVVVFALLCWMFARPGFRRFVEFCAWAAAGAVLGYAAVMLAAMANGTAPAAVFDATYPFRIEAARVLADGPATAAVARLHRLVLGFVTAGVPLVLATFAWRAARRARDESSYLAGIAGLLVWSAFSVLAGGSYWSHYLIESVAAVALAAGAVSVRVPRLGRTVAGLVVSSAVVAAGLVVVRPPTSSESAIGEALARAKDPGDSVVSAFGGPEVVRAAGMASPYPYLWSLPSRTLDPRLEVLRAILDGTAPPTWVVLRSTGTEERLTAHGVLRSLTGRYREVASLCGHPVFLLRGAERPVPVAGRCGVGEVLP